MTWFGLGKLKVVTPGSAVPLLSFVSGTPAHYKVNTLMITYDPADGNSTTFLKDRNGVIMASMAGATAQPQIFTSPSGGDQVDLIDFQVDVLSGNTGPFCALAIS